MGRVSSRNTARAPISRECEQRTAVAGPPCRKLRLFPVLRLRLEALSLSAWSSRAGRRSRADACCAEAATVRQLAINATAAQPRAPHADRPMTVIRRQFGSSGRRNPRPDQFRTNPGASPMRSPLRLPSDRRPPKRTEPLRDGVLVCRVRPCNSNSSTGSSSVCLLVCFVPALFFGRRAGQSTSEFFASGRAVPWWLAGLSMVATTFSSDTPNLVTDIVRRNGVAGNWVWWAFVLTGVSTVFFYARLWRRSGVLTDLEFYEIRYSGKAASLVRGFRAVYLGPALQLHDHGHGQSGGRARSPASCSASIAGRRCCSSASLNVVFATYSGLWGVLVIDMIQFFIKMSAVIAAAYFAVTSPQVGGLDGLMDKLSTHARARRPRLLERPAGLHEQLGSGGRGLHHADRRAVVGGLVSGRGTRRRQLHRAAHAGVEVGEGCARRRALLQCRALRAAPVAVDPRRALLAHRLSGALGHPDGVSRISIRRCSDTTSRIRRC